jgi:ribosomal-protein-alanine N-acetyltransferase
VNAKLEEVEISNFVQNDISENYLSWLNNPKHMQYSAQRHLIHTFDSAVTYMESFNHSSNHFFSIKVKEELVGTATLYVNVAYKIASPGILIAPEHCGKGFGKKAWEMLVFDLPSQLGIRKVSAGTLEVNVAMIRLFESCNMEFEARLKGESIFNELPADILLYRKFLS